MASTIEASVQPSTSNLISNPLIPTTITAEIVVENMQSSQSSQSNNNNNASNQAQVTAGQSMASTVVGSLSANALLAAIGSTGSTASSTDSNTQEMSGGGATIEEKVSAADEPEPKRRKLNTPCKSKTVEKLEARLGGILCCAVCLDLPRTAMYQVLFIYLFFLSI